MLSLLLSHGLQYASYALEVALVAAILLRGWWRKYPALFIFTAAFAFIDAILRPTVLYSYGQSSLQYIYCYWTTDLGLTLGAFLLICFFFRRACARNQELWPTLRTMLISVFVLVGFISCLTMSRHYSALGWSFAVELSQNVYFACLVLNTLLYIMLQYVDCADEALGLVVCGLGIEFAGPAAAMALAHIMSASAGSREFASLVIQFCNLGMWLIWIHAATRNSERTPVRSVPTSTNYRRTPKFVEAPVHGTH